jgi:hypothetical protein
MPGKFDDPASNRFSLATVVVTHAKCEATSIERH